MSTFKPTVKLFHKNNNKELYLLETTGAFDANNNLPGYDTGANTSGNPRLADVENVRGVFDFSDGTTGEIMLRDAVLPFPNYELKAKKVLASDFGKANFVDGLTKVKLFYDGNFAFDPFEFFSAEAAAQDFLTMNVQCCVQKLWAKVDTRREFCNNGNWKIADEAQAILEGIWNAAGNYAKNIPGCNQILKAQEMLKQLQIICLTNTTPCC